MNILIVEDDTAIREGVAEFLKENEYEVFCAEDGEKALEISKMLWWIFPGIGQRILEKMRQSHRKRSNF